MISTYTTDNNKGGNGSSQSQPEVPSAPLLGALQVLAATASNASNAPVSSLTSSSEGHLASHWSKAEGGGTKKDGRGTDGGRFREMRKSSVEGSGEHENGHGTTADNEAIAKLSGAASDSSGTELRKGKWTAEEEEFATRVIHFFSSGLITLPEGKTLRSYLAEKLQCDPMRITKKYAGAACLGKRIHHLCDFPRFTPQELNVARLEIERLEERFKTRLALGPGATLPPSKSNRLPSFMNTLSSEGLGYKGAGNTSNFNAQQFQVGSNTQQASNGNQQLNLSGLNSNISGGVSAPQPMSSSSNDPATEALLQSLASNPQFAASLANNPNLSTLMNSCTQSIAATAPSLPTPASAPAPLLSALKKMMQEGNMPTAMVPPPAASQPVVQQTANTGGLQQLLSSLNPTGNNNSNPNTDNEQLAQALLSQITDQLQTLADISQPMFQNLQSQLLSTPMPPYLNPCGPQQNTNYTMNDPSALLKAINQIAMPQAPNPSAQTTGNPGLQFGLSNQQSTTSQNTGFQSMPAQQQLPSIQGLLQAFSAQQQAPTQPAAATNLMSLFQAQQATAGNAPANSMLNTGLGNSSNQFISNVASASNNASQATSAVPMQQATQMAVHQIQAPAQTQQVELNQVNTLSQAISSLCNGAQSPSMLGGNKDLNALLDTLSHANALTMTQSDANERKRNVPPSNHQDAKRLKADNIFAFGNNKGDASALAKSFGIGAQDDTKKMWTNQPHGSFGTSNRIDTDSSSEDITVSNKTKNKGSKSSPSLPKEVGGAIHDRVPLKKRIKSPPSGKDKIDATL